MATYRDAGGEVIYSTTFTDAQGRRFIAGVEVPEEVWAEHQAACDAGDAVRAAAWRLVREQGRMLDRWAESDEHVRRDLWQRLHDAGDRLRDVLEESGEVAP